MCFSGFDVSGSCLFFFSQKLEGGDGAPKADPVSVMLSWLVNVFAYAAFPAGDGRAETGSVLEPRLEVYPLRFFS